ncbi:MAG: putative ral secretion pathway protein [Xanthobacteraceae bacterium]|jgi:general secretion pathway protein K|nr:putative ral secretion pathway protein [Xanthobacteraceae bacterium]
MSARTQATARNASDGFILVTVLWIIGALAALVSVYAVYIANTAAAAAVRNDDLVAQSLVTAAVELAAYRIVSAPKDERPTHGEVVFRMAKARIVAAFRNETARIDLNAAPRELLAGLFSTLGAKPDEADKYADRIIAWRTPASVTQDVATYREAGLDYAPRGASFVHVDEIWLVAGLPPALVEQALAHLTVFSGRADVLAREADPIVLASLPGAAPDRQTETPDPGGSPGGERQTALPGTTTEGGDAMRVTVRIDFDNGGVHAAEAVILLRDFGDDPYRVLSWRDGLNVEAPKPRTEARR